MRSEIVTLECRGRKEWRRWLAKNHRTSPCIWLLFYKQHTGKETLSYEDSIKEALCFGWVDSIVKSLDKDRYARKFTPRRPESKWSDINRRRWKELKEAGLLTEAGKLTAPTRNRYEPKIEVPTLPAFIAKAFKSHPKAWSFFQTLSAREKRNFVVWIYTAKRPETREKRIQESIKLLEAEKRLGLK
jgi:uncharacterized protein YdeI (YjbR/CyaY-like superfamily)